MHDNIEGLRGRLLEWNKPAHACSRGLQVTKRVQYFHIVQRHDRQQPWKWLLAKGFCFTVISLHKKNSLMHVDIQVPEPSGEPAPVQI